MKFEEKATENIEITENNYEILRLKIYLSTYKCRRDDAESTEH